MAFVNPLKLREYIAAGLPVVSTAVPEAERYPALCHVVRTTSEAVTAIEEALAHDSPRIRAARSEAMREETWTARVETVARRVDEVAQQGTR